ncbi:MAG: hypothetical protein WC294_05755 [Methanoregula sp.]|jgi:hypothetical protein
MKSSEVSKTFGINQPYAFPKHVLQKTTGTESVLYAGYRDTTKSGELEKNYYDLGIEVNPGELVELKTFREFLSQHIKPNAICDVQCMLLWAEWVRFYKKQTRKIPDLILEKEFRDLIINQFDLSVAEDGFRGFIYPGIKYVP